MRTPVLLFALLAACQHADPDNGGEAGLLHFGAHGEAIVVPVGYPRTVTVSRHDPDGEDCFIAARSCPVEFQSPDRILGAACRDDLCTVATVGADTLRLRGVVAGAERLEVTADFDGEAVTDTQPVEVVSPAAITAHTDLDGRTKRDHPERVADGDELFVRVGDELHWSIGVYGALSDGDEVDLRLHDRLTADVEGALEIVEWFEHRVLVLRATEAGSATLTLRLDGALETTITFVVD